VGSHIASQYDDECRCADDAKHGAAGQPDGAGDYDGAGRDRSGRDRSGRDSADRGGLDGDSADRDSAGQDSADRDSAGQYSAGRDSAGRDSEPLVARLAGPWAAASPPPGGALLRAGAATREGPGTPRLIRAINDHAALRALLERGPLTRPELGALIGLSKPTASQLLARLQSSGLVVLDGIREGGPGRTAEVYRLNPGAAFAAGVDVTPARIVAAISDITGSIVGEGRVVTPGRAGGDVLMRVRACVQQACDQAGLERGRLGHVVVGVPGAVNPATGRLDFAPHLPGWHLPDLLGRLAHAVGVPVDVENDVNLAAVAERAQGSAAGCHNFILVWVADGVGLAIVIGGQLHRGASGSAGEIGYMPVAGSPLPRDGRRPNTGGLQSLVGGPAIATILRASGFRGADPVKMAASAAQHAGRGQRDQRAQQAGAALSQIALRLATGLAAITSVLDPELVVLAGDIALAAGEPLRVRIERELHALTIPQPPLRLSTVTGNPVLAGALDLAVGAVRDEVFNTATG
jgi:predicted NBD/HSP70 family sugar kinase